MVLRTPSVRVATEAEMTPTGANRPEANAIADFNAASANFTGTAGA